MLVPIHLMAAAIILTPEPELRHKAVTLSSYPWHPYPAIQGNQSPTRVAHSPARAQESHYDGNSRVHR